MLIGTGIAVVAAGAGAAWYTAAGPTPRKTAPGGYQQPATATSPQPLAQVSDIPQGGGIVLDSKSIVLTRGTGDVVHAFTAICTHQGCLVSQVSGGKITCPCHGSTFDAGTGAVLGGPAPSALAAVPVTVRNGTVFSG